MAAVASGSWVERVMAGEPVSRRRGRLGVLWFLLAVVAAALGLFAVALLFAVVAGVAGLQTSAAWQRVRKRPVQLVAGAGAFAIVLAGALGTALVGLLAILFVVAAVVAAALDPARQGARSRRPPGVVAVAGLAVRCGYFTALGAAGAVAVARIDGTAFVVLLVLVSAYEAGDYLVGTGAGTPVEGPLAGIAAVAVLTFALSVFQLGPFDTRAAWVFGGLVAVLAPLGSIIASTLVPTAAAGGPALRRLDSWILVGPVWAWMLWGYLH